jgi:hypothetical protein
LTDDYGKQNPVYVTNGDYVSSNIWDTNDLDLSTTNSTALGAVVATGKKRLITEVTIYNDGTGDTFVDILSASTVKIYHIYVPTKQTVVWYGSRLFLAGVQVNAQASSVTGGHVHVSASGIEA